MSLNSSSTIPASTFDLHDVIKPYSRHWKWFAFSCVVALVLGYFFIRYSTPQFQVQSKIQILVDETSGSELTTFRDLGVASTGGNALVEDEIQILTSRSNFEQVVKNMGLNINIFSKGRVHDM